MTYNNYQIKAGSGMAFIIERFLKKRDSEMQSRKDLLDEYGAIGGLLNRDGSLSQFGFAKERDIPEKWNRGGTADGHFMAKPYARSKEGKNLQARMKSVLVRGANELTALVAGSDMAFMSIKGMSFQIPTITFERLGDLMILGIPDVKTDDWNVEDEPDLVLLKQSEYWALKEAGEIELEAA